MEETNENNEIEEKLNNNAMDIIDDLVNYEDHKLKGFHRTIVDDVRELLIQSNPTLLLSNSPKLVMILVTNLYSTDPCSSCNENVANVSEWVERNHQFNNQIRVLNIDALHGFDDKKIWEKLKISFDDVPLTLFFDESLGLVDVVQGIMSTNYLEMFWSPVFE